MPAGRGEEERFAAGVEYGSIPASLRTGDDEDLARELELVALLRSAGPALSPTAAARSRAKERLAAAFAAQHAGAQHSPAQHSPAQHPPAQHVAAQHVDTGPLTVIAPVTVAEPPEGRHAEPARRAGRHALPDACRAEPAEADLGGVRRLRTARRDRPRPPWALVGAAAAMGAIALSITGVSASQGALPGEPLYQVKRVAESTGYALTFGEQAKARRHLEQAQRRLDEVEGLVTRDQAVRASGAPVDPVEQERVRSTMQEFDSDANEGSRRLLADADDPTQADDVREWAAEQSARLSELRSTMPAQDKADESLALLDRLLGEATAASQAACDPSLGPCPTVVEGDPAGGEGVSGATVPEGTLPGTPEPRTTARGDRADPADGAGDDAPADDAPTGSSDDGSADGGDPDRSGDAGDSGGSGGGDADGSGDDVSVPVPLPAPVRVPSVAPGLPGVTLGG